MAGIEPVPNVREGGEKLLELWPKEDAPCLWSALLCVVLSFDLRTNFRNSNCFCGFSRTGVAFRFLSRLLKIQKPRKTTLVLLLLVGCKQALPRGRVGTVFRTCGAGVIGMLVARCVCVWATVRRSP